MGRKEKVRVGLDLKFFRWERERTDEQDPGALDMDKFMTALNGYAETLQRIGNIRKDARFEEFVAVAQQIMAELSSEDQARLAGILTWLKQSEEPFFEIV